MKHIIKKYSYGLLGLIVFLGGLTTIYILAAQSSTELRFNDQLISQFGSDIFTSHTDINFNYGGNQKVGMYLPRSVEILSTPEYVSLNGVQTGLCYGKIRGLYYNNERGERIWPLDNNTLTGLQTMDSEYATMQLTGGLFTNCTGVGYNPSYVYGLITMTYHNTIYYLMGGTDYNFTGNIHGTTLTGSLQWTNDNLSGYIWDNYGGIGRAINNTTIYLGVSVLTGTIYSGNAMTLSTPQTFVYVSGSNDYLEISGTQFMITNGNWNGIIVPPTPATGTGAATTGEVGLGTGRITFSIQAGATGASLITNDSMFIIDLVVPSGYNGQVVSLFRSQDGVTWTTNTPDTTCTLDSNKHCHFRTDHLSFFAGIDTSTTPPTQTNQGGGATLTKDNCKRSSTSKNNLSGANEKSIDYSPSYYDRTCEGPKATIKEKQPTPLCTSFTSELNGAYIFARHFNITTIDQCTNANMHGTLLRKDLAKMMVNFAEYVFTRTGIVVKNPDCDSFADIKNESNDMQTYIKKACMYGLMGLGSDGITPQDTFNPYGEITRAQFGTTLSRFIRGSDNNPIDGSLYYTKHLAALQRANIMKKTSNPTMKEIRGWVMLMMMRIYTKTK